MRFFVNFKLLLLKSYANYQSDERGHIFNKKPKTYTIVETWQQMKATINAQASITSMGLGLEKQRIFNPCSLQLTQKGTQKAYEAKSVHQHTISQMNNTYLFPMATTILELSEEQYKHDLTAEMTQEPMAISIFSSGESNSQ